MKLKRYHYITFIACILSFIADFFLFFNTKIFFFLLGLIILIGVFPFFVDLIYTTEKEREKEEMFFEFLNDLKESVAIGIPISKSIINISKRDYGALNHHVRKLANQIAIGIPLVNAFDVFRREVNNKIIGRTVELIMQAERAGGNIESIIEASLRNISEIREVNKKRQVAVHGMVVQGYIIFLIFLIIMLVIQLKLIPMLSTIPITGEGGFGLTLQNIKVINNIIFILIMVQGFFSGIIIGKLGEGKILRGLKHSFILMALSYILLQLSNLLK